MEIKSSDLDYNVIVHTGQQASDAKSVDEATEQKSNDANASKVVNSDELDQQPLDRIKTESSEEPRNRSTEGALHTPQGSTAPLLKSSGNADAELEVLVRTEGDSEEAIAPSLASTEMTASENKASTSHTPSSDIAGVKATDSAKTGDAVSRTTESSAPSSVTAANSNVDELHEAPMNYGPLPPSDEDVTFVKNIPQAREALKTDSQRVKDTIGTGINTVADGAVTVTDTAFNLAGHAVSAVAWLLALPALLFGVEPKELYEKIHNVVQIPFNTVAGIVEGAVRLPFQLLGVTTNFVYDLVTLKFLESPSRAIETFLQPIIGAGLAAVGPLFYGFKGLSDTLSPPRKLTAEEKADMEEYYPPEILDRIRVVDEPSLIASVFLPGMALAFTIDDTFYVNPDYAYYMDSSTQRHEIIHTLQYRETPGDLVGFLSSYYAQISGNFLTNGFDVWDAYENTDAEIEAYGLQNGAYVPTTDL